MRPLEGKRIILTGAAGGIGSLLATRLRENGAMVTGVDRVDCPACDDTIIADLSTPAGLAEISTALAQAHVDILVNVAGLQYFGPFEQQPAENIWLGYAVNLIAPTALARAVLPQMQGRGAGQIVNIGSMLGAVKYPFFVSYSSAKAGLQGLSEGLRRELHGSGIAVTHIAPRAARTAFNSPAVMRFMELTKMQTDEPDFVADRIVSAIIGRKAEVFIGFQERMFMRLNALFPRLIDAGLTAQTVKARQLFSAPTA
jgi:short-subunit dehydrogenase